MQKINSIAPDSHAESAYLLYIVLAELSLAFLLGCSLIAVGVGGGAWILSGITAGALVFQTYRQVSGISLKPNKNFRKIGQIFIGLTIGFSIQHIQLFQLSTHLPIFGFIALALLSSGGVIGWFYSRLEKTDFLTGVLATIPGNIGVMASIAADYTKNASLVSLVQLIRFTAIIFIVPAIAHTSHSIDMAEMLRSLFDHLTPVEPIYSVLLFLTLLTAFTAARLGERYKIPVSAFFCPIFVGIFWSESLQWFPAVSTTFNLPPLLKIVGQILLGTTIGEYWGNRSRLSVGTVLRAIVPAVMTFGAGLLVAQIVHQITHWDWLTCLLVAAPGGSPEMIWIALSMGHDLEIVTTGHLVRLLILNLSLPVVITLATKLQDVTASRDDFGHGNTVPMSKIQP